MPSRIATAILCCALAVPGGNLAAAPRTALPCTEFTSEALPPPAPRLAAGSVKRFEAIKARPATVRAYERAKEVNPALGAPMSEDAKKVLFGQTAAVVAR